MSQIKITPELLNDLKRKAGDAEGIVWGYSDDVEYTVYIVTPDGGRILDGSEVDENYLAHIADANPAVVLALVAEVERLRSFQAVAVEVIDKLNIYHECYDSDQCRSCEQINAGIEAISKAKREASDADQA